MSQSNNRSNQGEPNARPPRGAAGQGNRAGEESFAGRGGYPSAGARAGGYESTQGGASGSSSYRAGSSAGYGTGAGNPSGSGYMPGRNNVSGDDYRSAQGNTSGNRYEPDMGTASGNGYRSGRDRALADGYGSGRVGASGSGYGSGRVGVSGSGYGSDRGGTTGGSYRSDSSGTAGSGYGSGRVGASGSGYGSDRGGMSGSGYGSARSGASAGGQGSGRSGAAVGRNGTGSSSRSTSSGSSGYGGGSHRNPPPGGRGGQPSRPGAGRQPARNSNKKRRPPYDGMKIAIAAAVLLFVIVCVVGAVKYFGGKEAGEAANTTQTETQTETEAELQKEVTVDGISITGMSREDAQNTLMKRYEWGMKVIYEDKEHDVKDLMGEKIDALLEDIYTGEPKETYALDTSGLEEAIEAEVKAIAAEWDIPAKNGSISGFDKESGAFIYSGEQNGKVIVQDKLAADIKAQLEAKNFKAVIQAESKDKAPEITEAQAKDMYQVIGTYTTTTTANKDRNTNIRLAAEALNGVILQPGEEFSFNKATGERSQDKGYRPAGAYLNGELIEEPGGGVCQVSSTLYNAVVFSGLTTTERHAHSYEPSYVTPGEDAMVSYGGPDMKFVNSSPSAIAIRASFSDRKLKLSIVGIPILEKGVVLSMSSQKTGELDPPAPVYEEDQTIEPGTEQEVIKAKKGSRWVTNLITTKDGVEVSNEFFHNSTYRGKSATIKRNTSGVMIQPSTQPSESSSAGAGETTTAPDAQTSPQATEPHETKETKPNGSTEGTKGPGTSTEPSPQPAAGQPTSQAATQPAPGPGTAGEPQATAPQTEGTVAIPPNPMGQ